MATPNWGETRPRKGLIVLAVAALALVAALLYFLPSMQAYSRTGSAYAARVVCSCRYVGGRGMEDCQKDLEPGMEIVSLTEDEPLKRITASVPMLAEEVAIYREGYGCVLIGGAEGE